jgi:hypothetical protein
MGFYRSWFLDLWIKRGYFGVLTSMDSGFYGLWPAQGNIGLRTNKRPNKNKNNNNNNCYMLIEIHSNYFNKSIVSHQLSF